MPQESFSTAPILTSRIFQIAQLQSLEAEGAETQVRCQMTLSELDVLPMYWTFSHTGYDSSFHSILTKHLYKDQGLIFKTSPEFYYDPQTHFTCLTGV